MAKHAADPNETVQDVDLSDEVVWIYEDVLPDLLEDGRLTAANVSHLKHAGFSLIQGAAMAVALVVGPALWSEVQGGNFDVPSLLHTAYVLAVGALISYLRKQH